MSKKITTDNNLLIRVNIDYLGIFLFVIYNKSQKKIIADKLIDSQILMSHIIVNSSEACTH